MKVELELNKVKYQADLRKPLDISRPLSASECNLRAFGVDYPTIEPLKGDGWSLSLKDGAAMNCMRINFVPHCHGTHTETAWHIVDERLSINEVLKQFHSSAQLITVSPIQTENGDLIIPPELIKGKLQPGIEALVLRTSPNGAEKINHTYSETNPAYLLEETARLISDLNIQHLLLDLPSVDREKDDGKMLAHKAFWNTEAELRRAATITELIYVPTEVVDGLYLLNLQIASFESDAAPSKPVLYSLEEI